MTLVIDPLAELYILGSEIDYVTGIRWFVSRSIKNPNRIKLWLWRKFRSLSMWQIIVIMMVALGTNKDALEITHNDGKLLQFETQKKFVMLMCV